MKKLFVLLIVCAAVVLACGKKIIPESDANNPARPENDKTSKSGTQSANTNASASTPSFNDMQRSVPNNDNPRSVSAEKGKTVFVTKCNTCHALKNPGDYTVDQLNTILKAEIPKAKLNSKEAEEVTAYLLANAKK